MNRTETIMGIPIAIEVTDSYATQEDITKIFEYFRLIDTIFSTYKKDSEVTLFNEGKLSREQLTTQMHEVLQLAEDTKEETNGYFDIRTETGIDPSGIVKGWAIYKAANLLKDYGYKNFIIDAGGDIQTAGKNNKGEPWKIGIRNPFNKDEIIKVVSVHNKGIATSGTYMRGQHIYNPRKKNQKIIDIVSITVIGPTIYDADRFATAAFAMGKKGIHFIQSMDEFEGYMVDQKGIATYTQGFEQYVVPHI